MSGWTLRAVWWAPCSSNCKHMTMPPPITAIPSSNLQMTQLWWGFSLSRWWVCLQERSGAIDSVVHRQQPDPEHTRPRTSSWISGEENWTFNHYTSVRIVWRGCQTSVSWESTSWRTWPGMWTRQSWKRRPRRDFISWESSGKVTFLKNCWCPSAAALLRASCATDSVCGSPAAQQRRGKHFSES